MRKDGSGGGGRRRGAAGEERIKGQAQVLVSVSGSNVTVNHSGAVTETRQEAGRWSLFLSPSLHPSVSPSLPLSLWDTQQLSGWRIKQVAPPVCGNIAQTVQQFIPTWCQSKKDDKCASTPDLHVRKSGCGRRVTVSHQNQDYTA